MHVQTHLLSGWVAGNALPLGRRERLFCMAAATLPDVDGVGRVWSEELYFDLHHKLGHNVFFFALVAAVLAALSRRKPLAFAAYFVLGWLHFALDYLGSGPGWDLYPWWPTSDAAVRWAWAWPFYSWQNLSAFFALLLATLWIARKLGRTPLEALMPRLDRRLVDAVQSRP